jgi:hypothetical protein
LINILVLRKISILLAVSAAIMVAVPGLSLAPTSVYAQSFGGGEEDKDGDGVPNSSDMCPNTANPRCFKEGTTTTTPTTTQSPTTQPPEEAKFCYLTQRDGNFVDRCFPTKAECEQARAVDAGTFSPCD